jgi:membrane protease YdiL (CAAX protease family)
LNSFPDNPQFSQPETPAPAPAGDVVLGAPLQPAPLRDPIWSGLDVLRILIIGMVVLFASIFAMTIITPGATFQQRALRLSKSPELLIVAQMLSYVLLLGYMFILVKKERRSPAFWSAIHWNWPRTIWPYLTIGLVLQVALLGMERFLPLPKETPFDTLLRQPSTVILIAIFALTLGPLMEELFFRGFLYPVLARRWGAAVGIAVSALGFGLMHAAQYGYSWASVFLIFLVGVVLGIVRATKNSVAAGVLVHAGYNGTIILMLAIATDGFRHLEKLNQ